MYLRISGMREISEELLNSKTEPQHRRAPNETFEGDQSEYGDTVPVNDQSKTGHPCVIGHQRASPAHGDS